MNSDIEEITGATYSLQADMVTGWKPKLKIIGPMPLNYDNLRVDKSIMALVHQQSAFYQVVYLGIRPVSSFKLHQQLAKNYRYKYAYLLHNDFAHLKPFFKKFYSLFEPQVRRPFQGMNPTLCRKELVFDSNFEAGNLDCAVRLKAREYDLLLRVDSNTAGHVLWYNFRVTNSENAQKTIKFNLVNLRQNKSAYERGMRPYVKREGQEWRQEGENVEVCCCQLRYYKQNLSLSLQENIPQPSIFRKLSFELHIEPSETISIAYGIPYTYSQLLNDLKTFKKKADQLQYLQLDINYEYQSLSGLEIPLLKIKYKGPENNRYCVFMIARQHPGQSNSSYVIKGTIERLLSRNQLTQNILRHCDFCIIPMLNPDGVVAGNFRTSLFGKDLNRLFKTKDTTLIPQVEMARTVFTELSETYRKKLLLFLDYHGHSTRKNAFLLGPGIFDSQMINDIRVLPKIMANYTQIFRYPSCSFRIDQSKKKTARALFGKFAGLSYTIETSNWAYYSHSTKQSIDMQAHHFEELGIDLFKAVQQFILKKVQAKDKYSLKIQEEANKKLKAVKSKNDLKLRKSVTSRDSAVVPPKNRDTRIYTENVIRETEVIHGSLSRINEEKPTSMDSAHQSDELSQGGMDSDSEAEDMQHEKFKKYIKAASEMLVEFEKVYYGDHYRKGNSKYQVNNSKSNRILLQKQQKYKKKKVEHIQACLRPTEKRTQMKFEEPMREFRQNRRKFYLQESVSNIRESQSRSKQQKREKEDQNVGRLQPKLFQNFQPNRKGKIRISGMIREPVGISEELKRAQKFQILNFQKPVEYKRQEKSLQKLKFSPKLKEVQTIRQEQAQKGTQLLPFIKGSKAALQEPISTSSKMIPKTKDKFTDMLISQQLLNKSAVLNVLKLSRTQKQKSPRVP